MSFRYHRATDRITAGSWTLSTGTARAGYAATALDDADPSAPCWITGTSIALVRDFGTATAVGSVYLINHNFTNAAAVKVQMHTADSWATPDVSVTVTVPTAYGDGIAYNLVADMNVTKRYLRIVNSSANPVSIAIGEVLIYPSQRTLTKNVRLGFSQARERITSGASSKKGVSTVYDYGSVARSLRGTVPSSGADFDDLCALEADARGASRPFVVVLSPGHTKARWAEPLYVRIAAPIAESPQELTEHIPVSLSLQELGFGELVGA